MVWDLISWSSSGEAVDREVKEPADKAWRIWTNWPGNRGAGDLWHTSPSRQVNRAASRLRGSRRSSNSCSDSPKEDGWTVTNWMFRWVWFQDTDEGDTLMWTSVRRLRCFLKSRKEFEGFYPHRMDCSNVHTLHHSSTYQLKHSTQYFFSIPTVRKAVGKRAFMFKPPSDWITYKLHIFAQI